MQLDVPRIRLIQMEMESTTISMSAQTHKLVGKSIAWDAPTGNWIPTRMECWMRKTIAQTPLWEKTSMTMAVQTVKKTLTMMALAMTWMPVHRLHVKNWSTRSVARPHNSMMMQMVYSIPKIVAQILHQELRK